MTSAKIAAASRPRPEVDAALQQIRRGYLRVLAPIAVLVFLYNWYVDTQLGNLTPIDPYAYPIMAATYVITSAVIFIKPKYFRLAEVFSFVMFAAYMLLNLVVMLAADQPLAAMLSVATLSPWIPMLFVVAFITFHTRQAIGISGTIYLLMVIIVGRQLLTLPAILSIPGGLQLITNVFSSSLIYILLLSAVTLLKERFIAAEVRANTLAEVANYDYLTGVPNRRGVEQTLASMLVSQQPGHVVLIGLIDLDHFKQVNDHYGHAAGDEVLIGTAQALNGCIRADDIVGRWGGEEFLVIAAVAGVTDGLAFGERLRVSIAGPHYGQVGHVTASVGLTIARPGEDLDTLAKRADLALYRAKDAGRNRVEFAEA